MAERVFTLPNNYPDFPTQKRLSRSPKSPSLQRAPSDSQAGGSRHRERLPPPMKGINQVRFRQFKKQIDSIKKLSYGLSTKESLGKSVSDLSTKLKRLKPVDAPQTDRPQVSVGAFPRADLHRQTIALIRILKGVCAGLNANFQLVSGEYGDWRYSKTGPCPLCSCTCGIRPQLADEIVDVHLEARGVILTCKHCGDSVICEREDSEFVCDVCESGRGGCADPDTFSLFVAVQLDDASLHAQTDLLQKNVTTSPSDKHLRLRIGSTEIVTSSGKTTTVRLVLSKSCLNDVRSVGKIAPRTPGFVPASTTPTETTDPLNFDLSFSQNLLLSLQPPARDFSGKPLDEQLKLLHTEMEYMLTDHIQFAGRHQYVFEITDVCELYLTQYMNLMRRVWKSLMVFSPEAVSTLEMCVKGFVLVFEMSLASVEQKIVSLERQVSSAKRSSELTDARERLRQLSADLSNECTKSDKLEKSLKNVVRNYEEIIAMYHRDKIVPKPTRSASAHRHLPSFAGTRKEYSVT